MFYRMATEVCGVCGEEFEYEAKGRPRKYCSPACTQRSGAARAKLLGICRWCKEPNPNSTELCPTCSSRAHPGVTYKNSLHKRLRITEAILEDMRGSQNRRCAICKEERPLVLDHDHQTDKVRGLLCMRCNTMLHVEVTPEILQSAIDYLLDAQLL